MLAGKVFGQGDAMVRREQCASGSACWSRGQVWVVPVEKVLEYANERGVAYVHAINCKVYPGGILGLGFS